MAISLHPWIIGQPYRIAALERGLDVLIEVLNARCGDPVRPLIVTGNVKPSELPTVCDDRVADRVLAGTVFHLSGPSRRMKR